MKEGVKINYLLKIVILIILVFTIIPTVNAKDNVYKDHYVYSGYHKGDIYLNNSYYSTLVYNNQNVENVTFKYYDDNGKLLKSVNSTPIFVTTNYLSNKYALYELYCSNYKYWELDRFDVSDVTNNYESRSIVFYLKPYHLNKNVNIYQISGLYGDRFELERSLNDGDIILISDNIRVNRLVYNEEIYQSLLDPVNNNYFKVGYETANNNIKLEDNYSQYVTAASSGISSSGGEIYFYPYDKPDFYVKCDNYVLSPKKKYNCSLNVKSIYSFKKLVINSKYSNSELNIKKLNNFEYEISEKNITIYDKDFYEELQRYIENTGFDEDDYYYDYPENDISDNENDVELFYFTIIPTEKTTIDDLKHLFDIEYKVWHTRLKDQTISNFKKTKTINTIKTIINPLTKKSISIIVFIIFIIGISTILYFSKRKGLKNI